MDNSFINLVSLYSKPPLYHTQRIYRYYNSNLNQRLIFAANALGKMKLDLITAVVNKENQVSQRVLDKIKMNYQGVRHLYGTDLMYYELTKEAYEQL